MASTTWYRMPVIVLFLSVVALPVGAATLRVEKDGAGDFTVIQDAVDAAAAGDTILIGPGEYLEHLPFTTDGQTEETYVAIRTDSLTIRGADRDGVVIGPAVPDFTTVGPWGIAQAREVETYLRIENLTVRGMGNGIRMLHPFSLQGVVVDGCRNGVAHFEGVGSRIVELVARDCEKGVFTGTGVSDIVIESCSFLRNSLIGVGITRTANATVSNCQFIDDKGVQFGDGSTGQILESDVSGDNTVVSIVINSIVSMRGCTVSRSGINVIVSARSHLSGSGNILYGGFVQTLLLSGSSTADFHGNHILRNGTAPIVETDAYGVEPIQIDLTGNYWGTSSRDSIDAWTLDGEDLDNPPVSRNYSEILFEPFEPGPIPTERESVGGLKGKYRSPK